MNFDLNFCTACSKHDCVETFRTESGSELYICRECGDRGTVSPNQLIETYQQATELGFGAEWLHSPEITTLAGLRKFRYSKREEALTQSQAHNLAELMKLNGALVNKENESALYQWIERGDYRATTIEELVDEFNYGN